VVESKALKDEQEGVAEPERETTRVVVGVFFETKRGHPAGMEALVGDESGGRDGRLSRGVWECSWIMEGMNGVGNKQEGRKVPLPVPRALGVSLLGHLQVLHLHSPGDPHLRQVEHCPLTPSDQTLGRKRNRQILPNQPELPEGYEQ